jgi:hypothetical protein
VLRQTQHRFGGIGQVPNRGPGDGQTVHGLVGLEKVSWFLPILLPIDLNFRVHHVDQQVHCPFEGLARYRTQRRSLRKIVIRSRPSRIESPARCWMGIKRKEMIQRVEVEIHQEPTRHIVDVPKLLKWVQEDSMYPAQQTRKAKLRKLLGTRFS